MATDLTRPLKAAIITHLASSADVTALVPSSRIYAMTVPSQPEWPFIRYGSPISSGFEATCWDGSSTRVTLHAFAETTGTYAGEDRALDIAAAIVEAMESFDPADLGIVDNQYLQTRCIRDEPEADKWHAIVEFEVIAVKPN